MTAPSTERLTPLGRCGKRAGMASFLSRRDR
jgi:hypothetical protein